MSNQTRPITITTNEALGEGARRASILPSRLSNASRVQGRFDLFGSNISHQGAVKIEIAGASLVFEEAVST